jgi:hypothetical protein
MTCGTQVQFPVKALGDLKKVTAFAALYLRRYITTDFDIKVIYIYMILKIGCAGMQILCLGKKLQRDVKISKVTVLYDL